MSTYMINSPFMLWQDAYARCMPVWEELSRKWWQLDRLDLKHAQVVALTNKVENSHYLDSGTLKHPSIEEFMVKIRESAASDINTYVAFRPTILRSEDVFLFGRTGEYMKLYPVVDAYIYLNNEGSRCNLVFTICRCEMTESGRTIGSITEVESWCSRDRFTLSVVSDTDQYVMFRRNVMLLYLAVQMLSLERPEILLRETARENFTETVREKGRYRKVRRSSLVRVIRVPAGEIEAFVPRGHHEITCPCWGVAGHYRRCKSGRMAWVRPHRKGRERQNPEAYEPKEYVLPKGV